jgi:hypothetical protein
MLPKAKDSNSPHKTSEPQQDEDMTIEPSNKQMKENIQDNSEENNEMEVDIEQIDIAIARGISPKRKHISKAEEIENVEIEASHSMTEKDYQIMMNNLLSASKDVSIV